MAQRSVVVSSATAAWFAIAGAIAIARWSPAFTDAAHYEPVSIVDHAAVLLQTATMLATGLALLLLARRPPVSRVRALLAVAAAGAIAQSTGNLLEMTGSSLRQRLDPRPAGR